MLLARTNPPLVPVDGAGEAPNMPLSDAGPGEALAPNENVGFEVVVVLAAGGVNVGGAGTGAGDPKDGTVADGAGAALELNVNRVAVDGAGAAPNVPPVVAEAGALGPGELKKLPLVLVDVAEMVVEVVAAGGANTGAGAEAVDPKVGTTADGPATALALNVNRVAGAEAGEVPNIPPVRVGALAALALAAEEKPNEPVEEAGVGGACDPTLEFPPNCVGIFEVLRLAIVSSCRIRKAM